MYFKLPQVIVKKTTGRSFRALLVLLFVVGMFPNIVKAEVVTENFDTFTDGGSIGQYDVGTCTSGSNLNKISSTQYVSAPVSARVSSGGAHFCKSLAAAPTTNLYAEFKMYVPSGISGSVTAGSMVGFGSSFNGETIMLGFSSANYTLEAAVGGGTYATHYSVATHSGDDAWHDVKFTTDGSVFQVSVDGAIIFNLPYVEVSSSTLSTYKSIEIGVNSGWFTNYYDNLVLKSDADAPEPYVAKTKIISITPGGNATTSTSTAQSFAVTGYIDSEDYAADTIVTLYVSRNSSTQQTGLYTQYESIGAPYSKWFSFPVTTSGDFSFSSTTDTSAFLNGTYSIVATINLPQVTEVADTGIMGTLASYWGTLMTALEFANGSVQDRETTTSFTKTDSFIIGAPTYYDEATAAVVAARDNLMENSNFCNPLSVDFGIMDCLSFLFIPSEGMMLTLWNTTTQNVLNHAPFGYITRFIAILSNTSLRTQPVPLTYTYGTAAPEVLQGKTVTFQIFDHFDKILLIVSDDPVSPKNLWEIVMPFFQMTVGLAVLGVILWDVLQVGVPVMLGAMDSKRKMMNDRSSQFAAVKGSAKITYQPATLDMRKKYPRSTVDMRHK